MATVDQLLGQHRRFLAFVERRVRDRALAEELLQAAYAKSVERGGAVRANESAVAWFYRLLRNAIVDHQRAEARRRRVAGTAEPQVDAQDLRDAVCRCVGELVSGLKPEHAQAVTLVDLEGLSVPAYAAQAGITANNAGVRLHRARQALRKRVQGMCGACAAHGCLNCTCVDRKSLQG